MGFRTVRSFSLGQVQTCPSLIQKNDRNQHVHVLKTADEIINESEKYFDAIFASTKTAKSGCYFANQVTILSEHLSEGQSTPSTRGFQTLVAWMLKNANRAFIQAEDIEGRFGKIRGELMNASL